MFHIIDANNLAGKLRILDKEDFDLLLIELIRKYNRFDKRYMLVFDSPDPMGDKVKKDGLEIIYTPNDDYYNGADDKIIELVDKYLEESNNEIKVVTDDSELIKRLEKFEEKRIIFQSASEFAGKLQTYFESEEEITEDDLEEKEKDKINKELLEIWK